MKAIFKFLALSYLLVVVVLMLLEFTQVDKVNDLRAEIGESHQLIATQDEGVRLELDYRRFSDRLNAYVRETKPLTLSGEWNGVNREEMLIWFDIFWSRVFQINEATVGLDGEQYRALLPTIVSLRQTLRDVDPLVQSIMPGELEKLARINAKLVSYSNSISSAAARISQNKQERGAELQHRLELVLVSMDKLLLTSMMGAGLLLALFGAETFRARREERKTKMREARVRFMAEHDSLTGLANRTSLNSKMSHYMSDNDLGRCGFHLLLLDLDKFKYVNDTYGHPMGDRLLKKAASRLLRIFSDPNDIVARLGGDEFAILTKSDMETAKKMAKDVIQALSDDFTFGDLELRISTSIGISNFPRLSSSADDLMRDADLALYSAKNNGRGTFMFYDPMMGVAIQHRMQLEADLRKAIQNEDGGLEVYYQPQVTLADQGAYQADGPQWRVNGVEALVRWFHPERGQISPMEFIAIAEDAGMIDALSDWIIREALADAVQWHLAGHKINLSVNLSPLQLNNPKLPEELLGHLDQCGFDPTYLTLEITESVDVEDTKAAAKMLSRLADEGISLAMDDFGTGYSNLGYLSSLPLHTLKIDRSFISGLDKSGEHRKLVLGIIQLAHGMGLKVVAEGIETEEQLVYLKSLNCAVGQGYLFGRPMNKLKILSTLNQQRRQDPRSNIRCIA